MSVISVVSHARLTMCIYSYFALLLYLSSVIDSSVSCLPDVANSRKDIGMSFRLTTVVYLPCKCFKTLIASNISLVTSVVCRYYMIYNVISLYVVIVTK